MKRWGFTGLIIICVLFFLPSSGSAQGDKVNAGIFEPAAVAPGAVIEIPVEVRDVQDLYAFDITIEFDPALVEVVDANTSMDGIQVALGDFLDAGLLLFNTADNEAGTIRFVMSQYNPSEGKSGSGNLLIVRFKGLAQGQAEIRVTDIVMSDRAGVEIPSEGVSSTITVAVGAPTQAATYPVAEATGMIVLTTDTPTPVPTETPVPTLTPAVTDKAQAVIVTLSPAEVDAGEEKSPNVKEYFLVENWWIVLLLFLAVAGAGVYTFVLKKRKK